MLQLLLLLLSSTPLSFHMHILLQFVFYQKKKYFKSRPFSPHKFLVFPAGYKQRNVVINVLFLSIFYKHLAQQQTEKPYKLGNKIRIRGKREYLWLLSFCFQPYINLRLMHLSISSNDGVSCLSLLLLKGKMYQDKKSERFYSANSVIQLRGYFNRHVHEQLQKRYLVVRN